MDQKDESKKYAIDLPYPEVKVHQKDLEYAKIIQEDYAGYTSETTAIMQYSYHHFITSEVDKEIADALEGIAIVEMHHMEILADLIVKLSGNPVFMSMNGGINQYWNGSYVKYTRDIKQLLYDDIKSEQEAIYQYTKHLYFIRDSYIQDIIKRLIMDEKHHIEIFTQLLNKQIS